MLNVTGNEMKLNLCGWFGTVFGVLKRAGLICLPFKRKVSVQHREERGQEFRELAKNVLLYGTKGIDRSKKA